MDDAYGIRVLAGLVDLIRDKDTSILDKLAAYEKNAAAYLAEAKATLEKSERAVAETKAISAGSVSTLEASRAARDEMKNNLLPREAEVAAGASTLQVMRKALDKRVVDLDERERDITKRSVGLEARERRQVQNEAALKLKLDAAATAEADYKGRVASMKKVINE